MFLATRGDEAHPCRFSMSPAWRAWNRWVAHLELPEEDLVVVQLPSGSGHGKLAAAALGGLEEQRAAAGCDVEDVTVTVVAPPPQSALLRLSIEARWPPQWAHAVTDIIPLPEHVSGGGTSTSVRPHSAPLWDASFPPPRRNSPANGPPLGRDGRRRNGCDGQFHGQAGATSVSIPADTLPSGHGAAFFAAYRQVKGRP